MTDTTPRQPIPAGRLIEQMCDGSSAYDDGIMGYCSHTWDEATGTLRLAFDRDDDPHAEGIEGDDWGSAAHELRLSDGPDRESDHPAHPDGVPCVLAAPAAPDAELPAAAPPAYDAQRILGLPLEPDHNDAGAATVRDYLVALLAVLWECGEGFSGKRPFGESGWQGELYEPLIRAGIIDGLIADDGWMDGCDRDAGDDAIAAAIEGLRAPAATD